VLGAGGYLAALALRSPRKFAAVFRSLGAAVLDYRFDEQSPLPMLPQPIARLLRRQDVVLTRQDRLRHGNQDLKGLVSLVSLARALQARNVFEIGTFTGLTALMMAANLPEATIHTLDLPEGANPVLPLLSSDREHLMTFARMAYEDHPAAQRIVQHRGDSARFDFSPFKGRCQLVYIDGAHSLPYVANDTVAALEMVSARGAVVWDDYWRLVPDVARYLNGRHDLKLYRLPETRLVVWFSEPALAFLESEV
jgi:predicted O-methyltransferase YrrM